MSEPSIERTTPMRMHKNLVIQWLESHPEDFASIVPDHSGHTLEQYLAELKAAPGQWFVGGELEQPAGRLPEAPRG